MQNLGVVFDFDGTITLKKYGSLYKVVDMNALPKEAQPEYEQLRDKYLPRVQSGTLAPVDELYWLRETLDIYVRCGLTRAKWQGALEFIELREDAGDVLRGLADLGFKLGIISYGVVDFIEFVLAQHGLAGLFDRIYAARLIHDEVGLVVGYEPDSFVYPDNKDFWSHRFAGEMMVDADDLLAVGDSGGDKKLGFSKMNRLGLANDPRECKKIQRYFGMVSVTNSFEPVGSWVLHKLNQL